MILIIKNPTDRRTLAGILAENGYKVEFVKVKDGKATKQAIKAEKAKQEVIDYADQV